MTVDKAVCVCASLAHNVKDDNVAALCWERHRQAVEQHEQSAIQLVNELSESANWRMGLDELREVNYLVLLRHAGCTA